MKHYLFLFISFLIFGECYAQDVTSEQAEKVAVNFMKHRNFNNNKTNLLKTPKEKEKIKKYDYNGAPSYYVVNFEEGGYAVISAYDGYVPILAYSESGSLNQDDMNPGFLWLLDSHSKIIDQLRKSKTKDPECITSWKKYEGDASDAMLRATTAQQIGPLLTSQWRQGSPYNKSIEKSCGSDKCAVGCVALAAGQVFRYYNQSGRGLEIFKKKSILDFDWNNMPDWLTSSSPDIQKNAIAKLLADIGKRVNMNYCSGARCESSAYTGKLESVFRDYGYKAFYKDIDDTSILRMLGDGHPVLVSGYTGLPEDPYSIGHAYVIDGYRDDGTFHFNYGLDNGGDDFISLGSNQFKISLKGFLDITYVGFDCESICYAGSKIVGLSNGETYICNPPVYGTFETADSTYWAYTRTIPSGDTAVYKAYKEVIINYGFTVELGASLTAEIVPCPND